MTNIAASRIDRVPSWRLLGEFVVTPLPDSDRQLLDQVMAAIQGLNLQPVQLERIDRAFVQAVARAIHSVEPAAIHRLRIRIWVLGSCAYNCGWSFFLVEKQGNDRESTTATVETENLVELFLYQERGS